MTTDDRVDSVRDYSISNLVRVRGAALETDVRATTTDFPADTRAGSDGQTGIGAAVAVYLKNGSIKYVRNIADRSLSIGSKV